MPLKIPKLHIPVFVSCPSALRTDQEQSAQIILDLLQRYNLQWRALGRPDYPRQLPLREVIGMIRHCSGGIVLGFEQYSISSGVYRRGVKGKTEKLKNPVLFPTPWNQLEAGILFSLNLPILVFREPGVGGGIFDVGVTDVFTHDMPTGRMSPSAKDDLDRLVQRWAGEVSAHYYGK